MIIAKIMKVKMILTTNNNNHHHHYNYNHWRKKVKEDIWSKVWTIKFRQPYSWLKVATYMYIQWQMAGGYAHTFEAKKKSNKRTFRKEHLMHSFMFFTIFKFTIATSRDSVTAFLLSQFILPVDNRFNICLRCSCSRVQPLLPLVLCKSG